MSAGVSLWVAPGILTALGVRMRPDGRGQAYIDATALRCWRWCLDAGRRGWRRWPSQRRGRDGPRCGYCSRASAVLTWNSCMATMASPEFRAMSLSARSLRRAVVTQGSAWWAKSTWPAVAVPGVPPTWGVTVPGIVENFLSLVTGGVAEIFGLPQPGASTNAVFIGFLV